MALKVASSLIINWALARVCDGVADAEYGACAQAIRKGKAACAYIEFAAYLSSRTFPTIDVDLAHLFSDSAFRKHVENGSFMRNASGFLTMALC